MPASTPQYEYSYDESVYRPLQAPQQYQVTKNVFGTPVVKTWIKRHADNIKPIYGAKDFAKFRASHISEGVMPLMIMRHGTSQHNEDANEFTKEIQWLYLPTLASRFDPGLTDQGIRDAKESARNLRQIFAPLPNVWYTSPQLRALETAMYTIKELGIGNKVTLHVEAEAREWVGWGHNHMSDRRRTSYDLNILILELRGKLGLKGMQFAIDPRLDQPDPSDLRETYTEVERRFRRLMGKIYDGAKAGDVAIIVTHNRAHKCFLRAMGHAEQEVEDFELEPCTILPYLMSRAKLTVEQVVERKVKEDAQSEIDRKLAEEDKARRHAQAELDIQKYRTSEPKKLRNLVKYLEKEEASGDGEATKVLQELCRAVPDLYAVHVVSKVK